MKIDAVAATMNAASVYSTEKAANDQSFAKELEKAAQQAKSVREEKKLQAVCKDFEAMFLNLMYSKMRETVPENTLYGSSHGEKLMQSMLDTELTKNMAEAGGIGLGAMMYKQLSMQYNNTKQ